MKKSVNAYFEKLEGLSTEELDRSTEKLVRNEKRNVAQVIAHIAEMSRRKGALEQGYKNLFEYCTRRLKLSEGSVAMRIQVANVCRKFPELLLALAENRLSLTVAGLLAPHLTEAHVEKLLSDCAGKSKRETEEYLVALRPRPVFAPSIRKVPSRPREPRSFSLSPPEKVSAFTLSRPIQEGPAPPAPRKPVNVLQPAEPQRFNFRFSADRKFKEKLERLAEVLGAVNPQQQMAEIFEKALDIALEQKDPKRRLERRLKKQAKRNHKAESKSRPDEVFSSQKPARSRQIPPEVQERVFWRSGCRCEFRGPDGTRCRARTGLELERVKPFALHRTHDERFLQVLCKPHNVWSAEQIYGAAFMQRKIDASRRARAGKGRPT